MRFNLKNNTLIGDVYYFCLVSLQHRSTNERKKVGEENRLIPIPNIEK